MTVFPLPELSRARQSAPEVWMAVDAIVDRTPDVERLRAHRLHVLAARRWRAEGRDVPDALVAAERRAALTTMLVPEVLARVRRAASGPLIVHKGAEVALRYPDPVLRPYIDLDLLVPDPSGVQRALHGAGFAPVGDESVYSASPHLQPLEYPGLPLIIEIHGDPNWPRWLGPAPTAELVAGAVDSGLGVDGVLTLAPAHHALVVAAHAWAHGPLARVGDLLDVCAMSTELDPSELERLADGWGLGSLWRTTNHAADVVFRGARPTWASRSWARNLAAVRERTVFEYHLGRWLAPFSALSPAAAVRVMGQEVGRDLRPRADEGWVQKIARTGQALRRAHVRKSAHDEELSRRERR